MMVCFCPWTCETTHQSVRADLVQYATILYFILIKSCALFFAFDYYSANLCLRNSLSLRFLVAKRLLGLLLPPPNLKISDTF